MKKPGKLRLFIEIIAQKAFAHYFALLPYFENEQHEPGVLSIATVAKTGMFSNRQKLWSIGFSINLNGGFITYELYKPVSKIFNLIISATYPGQAAGFIVPGAGVVKFSFFKFLLVTAAATRQAVRYTMNGRVQNFRW